MPRFAQRIHQSLPLVAGIVFGLAATWWTSVHASVLLPNLSLTTLSSGQTVSGVVSLSAQADATGLSSLQFVVSGQNVGTTVTSGSCVTSWDTTTMSNGSHTVTAVAADSVGATVWAQPIVVTVQNAAPTDTAAPTVNVTAPAAGASVSGTVTLAASASDNVGVSATWFTVDGTTVGGEDTTAPYQASWNTTGVSNGSHVVRALARDAAGNVGTSAAVTVTVNNSVADTTAPTVTMSGPANGATVSGTVSVSASASDNVAVTSVQFTLDGVDLGAADTTAPFSTSWNTSGASNGAHQLRALARDAAGNTAMATAITVTVNNTTADTVAPTVNVTTPAASSTVSGSVTLSASASDNVAVTSVQFTVDGANVGSADTTSPYSVTWNSASASNGSHVVRAVAVDAAGNATTSAGVTVTVSNTSTDTTRPSVSLTAPSSGATVSGTVTVSASASDNVGVVSVQFTLDGVNLGAAVGVAPWSTSWNTAGVANGSHVLRAVARDAAGNSRTSTSRTVTVNNVSTDTVAPTVGVTQPADGSIVGGMVTLAASASDNVGVTQVTFVLNGTTLGQDSTAPYTLSWSTSAVSDGPQQILAVARDAAGSVDTAAPFQVTWNTTSAANGSRVVRAVAKDAAGNTTTSAPITVTISNTSTDTTRPTVSVTTPTSGATVTGVVSVAATASDNVGVVGVQFTLDGANIGAEDTVSPYQLSWNTTAVSNGLHTLRAIARDAAGNTRTSTRSIVVSNSAADVVLPTVAFATPANNADVSGGVNITVTAGDNVGVVGVQFTVDGVNVGPEDTASPYQVSWNTAAALNGRKNITAIARDAAGNVGTALVQVRVRNLGSGVAGDLNNDGFPDLLFRHSSGQLYSWFMRWGALEGERALTPSSASLTWQIVGLDDFDGDKKSDVLLQHATTGQLYVWFMDGTTLVGEQFLSETATPWRVAATGDFNGDGKTDLVWQHPDTGQLYAWLLDGVSLVNERALAPAAIDPSWRIAGTGDMNQDGKSDLVWQNMASGALAYWFMDSFTAIGSGGLRPGATGITWHIKAVADFDADGFPDLVWQNVASGQLYVWFMHGPDLWNDRFLTPSAVGLGWEIVGGK